MKLNTKQAFLLFGVILAAGSFALWKVGVLGPSDSSAGKSVRTAPTDAAELATKARLVECFDPSLDLHERIESARRIGSGFSLPTFAEEIDGLLADLTNAQRAEAYVVFNEVLEQTRRRGLHHRKLTGFLSEFVADKDVDPVLRDYAVQHLALWISPAETGYPAERRPKEVEKAVTALCDVVEQSRTEVSSISGTSLTSLSELGGRSEDLKATIKERLDESLAELLTDEKAWTPNRIAAAGSAPVLGGENLLGPLRKLIDDSKTDPGLRIAAIHALGELGTTDDTNRLRDLAKVPAFWREAAKLASITLANRLSNEAPQNF